MNGLLSSLTVAASSPATPWLYLGLFMAASVLMIWRLDRMSASGVEGTVLGTLVMPYCSGIGNLVFACVMTRNPAGGDDVLTNCLVNNVTNMTLLIGVPALAWGLVVIPGGSGKRKGGKDQRINRLSLLLTLAAVMFFTGAVWALARDGRLDFGDGLVLVGLFLFWQCIHVFEVLKANVQKNRSFSWMLPVDLALLAVGAWGIFVSVDWLVGWISQVKTGMISAKHLGWLSGWLMVLPNALLAFYYGWRGRADITVSSQVGDGHICIPLCIGIFALVHPIPVPAYFETAATLIIGAAAVLFVLLGLLGRIPRMVGWLLVGAYGVFLYKGLAPS